jgi:ATP-dependent Clp protease ATP-binding subunit ClpA
VGAFAANKTNTPSNSSATTRFTTDLTQLGRDGRLRENLSLENDTLRLIKVLAGGGQRQPVIVDEKGENQDFVVEQLAMRIAGGNVNKDLSDVSILKLETATLFSSAKSTSEASSRIESVIDEVVASNNKTILFIDELTNVLEVGNAGTKLV